MAKKILVIDDESAIRKSFQLALEDTGYEVHTADSGETGISAFGRVSYDLVYLDLKMPGINGAETLRRLRQLDRDTPIYVITAFYEEFFDDLQGAADEGVDFDVLRKPISMDQIESVTRGILEGPVAAEIEN